MPELTHKDILIRAERLLNVQGWCKDGWSCADTGALCIVAAMCDAIDPEADFEDPDDVVPRGVMDAFFFSLPSQYRHADSVGMRKGAIYDFNDCEDSNMDDLHATFRDAIALAGEVIFTITGDGVMHIDRGFCHPERLPVIAMSETECMTEDEFVDRFQPEFHRFEREGAPDYRLCLPVRGAALDDEDRIAALNGFIHMLREKHAEVMKPHRGDPRRHYKWRTRLH